jgi:LDH2 family malate/lactate/ureidoglycolate dehydrogenase
MSIIRVKSKKLETAFINVLDQIKVRHDVSQYLVNSIIQASLRGIDSHGVRLFPHYLKGFKHGRLNKNLVQKI